MNYKKEYKPPSPQCKYCKGPSIPILQREPNAQDPSLFICIRCGRVLLPDGTSKNRHYAD